MAACEDDVPTDTTGGATDGTGGSGQTAAPVLSAGWQDLDGHIAGHHVAVRVSPLVRNDDGTTVLAVELTRAADDASSGDVTDSFLVGKDDPLSASVYLGSTTLLRTGHGAEGVRLIDTATGRVWSATNGTGDNLRMDKGDTVTSYVTFGSVDADKLTVVPQTGFAAVGLVDRTAAADAQLQTVADQITQYPDGGTLDIVGHTDDIADDTYNQTLSEKRANAVKDRLTGLATLDSWTVTVTGKGETEPLINDTTDEARAANRRVEITLTPTGGTTNGDAGSTGGATPTTGSDTSLPEARGAVGKGPDGLAVTGPAGKGQITVSLDHVTRTDGYLLGTSDGLVLLTSDERVLPADYLDAVERVHLPLTETQVSDTLKEGATTTICCVWPDTGTDTVVLDHRGAGDTSDYAFRLTDIPVLRE